MSVCFQNWKATRDCLIEICEHQIYSANVISQRSQKQRSKEFVIWLFLTSRTQVTFVWPFIRVSVADVNVQLALDFEALVTQSALMRFLWSMLVFLVYLRKENTGCNKDLSPHDDATRESFFRRLQANCLAKTGNLAATDRNLVCLLGEALEKGFHLKSHSNFWKTQEKRPRHGCPRQWRHIIVLGTEKRAPLWQRRQVWRVVTNNFITNQVTLLPK